MYIHICNIYIHMYKNEYANRPHQVMNPLALTAPGGHACYLRRTKSLFPGP